MLNYMNDGNSTSLILLAIGRMALHAILHRPVEGAQRGVHILAFQCLTEIVSALVKGETQLPEICVLEHVAHGLHFRCQSKLAVRNRGGIVELLFGEQSDYRPDRLNVFAHIGQLVLLHGRRETNEMGSGFHNLIFF